MHVYENTPCVHVAPFRHGDDAHSLMSVSQIAPLYPATHVHVYMSVGTDANTLDSLHVAPFTHGADAHSLISLSQFPRPQEVPVHVREQNVAIVLPGWP